MDSWANDFAEGEEELDYEENIEYEETQDSSLTAAGSSQNTDESPATKLKANNDIASTSTADNDKNEEQKEQELRQSSRFAMTLEKYEKSQDKVGKSVYEEIAALANEKFKKGVDKDHFKAMAEIIERPENCPSVTEVRVNDLIWNLLSPPTRASDEKNASDSDWPCKGWDFYGQCPGHGRISRVFELN